MDISQLIVFYTFIDIFSTEISVNHFHDPCNPGEVFKLVGHNISMTDGMVGYNMTGGMNRRQCGVLCARDEGCSGYMIPPCVLFFNSTGTCTTKAGEEYSYVKQVG